MIPQLLSDERSGAQQLEIDALEATVQRRVHGGVRNLRLLILEQGVVLQGQVFTYHAKQLAQHAVMAATKMPIVANEIMVLSASCRLQPACRWGQAF